MWTGPRRNTPIPGSLVVARLVVQLLGVFLLLAVVVTGSRTPVGAFAPVVPARRAQQQPQQRPPANIKILILPGFFNDASDYTLAAPGGGGAGSLVQSLQKRGFDDPQQIRVLPVQRSDWLQVFWRGALDIQFWQGVAPPTRPAFAWYLERVARTIQEMTTAVAEEEDTDDDTDNNYQVLLLCHSAGGWLARAVLGYLATSSCSSSTENNNKSQNKPSSSHSSFTLDQVCGIVTLGAPHQPPPSWVMDMTRGALKQTHENFPGAHHQDQLFYVTVIGNAVQGVAPEPQRMNPFQINKTPSRSEFAYNSYRAVCGDGTTVGDGVVPIRAAHLEGALQLNLDGVFHSIDVPDQWYGSDAVLDLWYQPVLQQILLQQQRQQKPASKKAGRSPATGTFQNPFASIFRR
jgi:hypothetical protein